MIFEKCPVCGELAFVKSELCNSPQRVFECEKGHVFKKKVEDKPKTNDEEIWENMPEWAKLLKEAASKMENNC